jgi:hypothetical protein
MSDDASPALDPQASVCELSDLSSPADDAESERAIAEREADPFSTDYKQTLILDEPTSSQLRRGTCCIPSFTVPVSAQ